MRTLLITILLVLLPAAGWAQDAAEAVAAKAQKAHEENCARAAGAVAEADAARAISEVGAIWAEVAEVYEATGATWLLYWKGLLAQCIGQKERAIEALTEFVGSDPSSEGLAAMDRDARKRLRRLDPNFMPLKVVRPPMTAEQRARSGRVGGGLILGLGAAGAGVGSGFGFGGFSATRATVVGSLHTRAEADGLVTQGNGQLGASVGLAVGAGAAMAVAIGVLAARGGTTPEVAVVPVVLDGGVGLSLGGRW